MGPGPGARRGERLPTQQEAAQVRCLSPSREVRTASREEEEGEEEKEVGGVGGGGDTLCTFHCLGWFSGHSRQVSQ